MAESGAGTAGGGAIRNTLFASNQGAWLENDEGDPDFSYTQDVMTQAIVSMDVGTGEQYSTILVGASLAQISQTASTLSWWTMYKINAITLQIMPISQNVEAPPSIDSKVAYLGNMYIVPWNKSINTKPKGGSVKNVDVRPGFLPGAVMKPLTIQYDNSADKEYAEITDLERDQVTTVKMLKPMYEISAESSAGGFAKGVKFSSDPLQIETALGLDQTVWRAFYLGLNHRKAAEVTGAIYFWITYKINITLSGPRWNENGAPLPPSTNIKDSRIPTLPALGIDDTRRDHGQEDDEIHTRRCELCSECSYKHSTRFLQEQPLHALPRIHTTRQRQTQVMPTRNDRERSPVDRHSERQIRSRISSNSSEQLQEIHMGQRQSNNIGEYNETTRSEQSPRTGNNEMCRDSSSSKRGEKAKRNTDRFSRYVSTNSKANEVQTSESLEN